MRNSPYEMTIDLNVLKHLGINLYSNVAAVLTEVVANAWDADASRVDIEIDSEKGEISIEDDGIGMSIEDMNNKYLRVGYCRRTEEKLSKTAKGRQVMGRKGLGKLSLFSIAKNVEVQSCIEGGEPHGCLMSIDKMEEAVREQGKSYIPDVLPTESLSVIKGTKIRLTELIRSRLNATAAALRVKLARRFSIIGEEFGFNVYLNGSPISVDDRDDLKSSEFVWPIGQYKLDDKYKDKAQEVLSESREGWPGDWRVSGWIGTSAKPKDLDKDGDNLNGVVVIARGRLFHENVLDKINDGRLYTKYVTGQIQADFLDKTDSRDIATSDRQRIQENDPRYIALIAYLKECLNNIEKKWSELRGTKELAKLVTNSEGIKGWLSTLKGETKKSAEKMLVQLSGLTVSDDTDRKGLYRHGILAFERIRLREKSRTLSEGICKPEKLLELLADKDSFESSLYSDIVSSRLSTINEFFGLIEEDKIEKVLQKYLFNHLWLLDPAWERASEVLPVMERRLIDSGIYVEDATEKEKLGRVDIAYRLISGKHVLIELKRASRVVSGGELFDQGSKYVSALKKVLAATDNDKNPSIEVIFVLGKKPNVGDDQQIENLVKSISSGSTVVYYDSLVKSAQQAYASFLDAQREVDKIEQFLAQI